MVQQEPVGAQDELDPPSQPGSADATVSDVMDERDDAFSEFSCLILFLSSLPTRTSVEMLRKRLRNVFCFIVFSFRLNRL